MKARVAPDVAEALGSGRPVVALESTIIAHGFPRPRNLDVAHDLEAAVRSVGAVPATIAVLDGELVVGLDAAGLRAVAEDDVAKVNVANLAVVVARRASGATTVSATLRVAGGVGIAVMATGGIGGVHRSSPTDVSADLPEIARAGVAVVSSGAKAFLDLRATLDYLESAGVPVVGYRTSEFPAFYSPTSGLTLDDRVDSPQQAADIVRSARAIGSGSVVIANPIPDSAALDDELVARWIEEAERRADAADVTGPRRSPFVLAELADLSNGATVEANHSLAIANASLAADIAMAL